MSSSLLQSYPTLEKSYLELLQDLDLPELPYSITNFAQSYFNFAKTMHDSFMNDDFSHVMTTWNKFDIIYEAEKINLVSLGNTLHENALDYRIFNSYLDFIKKCQESIAKLFFDTFFYDLNKYNDIKELIPPFIFFTKWLDKTNKIMPQYFDALTQKHINSLAYFNDKPIFAYFIDRLFLWSGDNLDDKPFDAEYYRFHSNNLTTLNKKELFFDTALKNNTISLPKGFIDYLISCLDHFKKNTSKPQSTSEIESIKDFIMHYEQRRLRYLLPLKHMTTKVSKI